MNDNVKGFLTTIGGTIIAYVVEETQTHYVVENALAIQQSDDGKGNLSVGFSPLTLYNSEQFAKGLSGDLQRTAIIMSYNVRDDLKAAYSQAVGRITVITNSSKIVLGK